MTDPQTLNKYSYVRNNPLIYTDPTGLDLWLKGCQGKTNCNHGYVGTWDADHKHFTRTHITDNDKLNVTIGNNGVKVQVGSNSYQGVWDTNKGEGNTVTATGTGDLSHFDAKINGDCGGAGGPCNSSGYLVNHGTNDLAKAGDVRSALTNPDGSAKSGWMANGIDIFHTDPAGVMTSFNGVPSGTAGQPSTDVTVSGNPAASTNFHVNSGYPFEDLSQFLIHSGSALEGMGEGIGIVPKHD